MIFLLIAMVVIIGAMIVVKMNAPKDDDEDIEDMEEQPNKYVASGHVKLIRDKCHPVAGRINPITGKMRITKISKENYSLTASGEAFNPADPNGEMYDMFLYVPRYWYKGVNDYKNARKHFLVSSRSVCPESTATITQRLELEDLLYQDGKAISNEYVSEGDTVNTATLATATNLNLYRVDVSGMKQVRFPGLKHSYFVSAFADATVPKVNVIVGKAFGTAYVAMNSKAIGADMVYAWPESEIGMMDASLAAKIMYAGSDAATLSAKAAEYKALQSSVEAAAARGYVDTIIAPADTRKYVIGAFEVLFTKKEERPAKKHGTI